MNFKTTIVLVVLLLGVGIYVLATRDKAPDVAAAPPAAHTVTDVKSADVTALTITGPDGKVVAVEKAGDAWRLTQPVKAVADTFKVTSLIDEVTTNLKATSVVKGTGPDAPKTGVDQPKYTVEVTANGHTTKLAVGDTLGVSDGVYVQVPGSDTVSIVPASLLDTLGRPANDLRKTQLFENVSASDVQQLTVTHRDGSKLQLQKVAGAWKVIAPAAMPADTAAVEELLSAVINLTPTSFVDDPTEAVGLAHPTDVVSFSTAAPTTAPTTGPSTGPAPMVVTIGGYDDVQKKNVYASLADGTVVRVPATVLDAVAKSPLDLRDKAVTDVDPAKVTRLEIAVETPATTQPTTRPASVRTVVLTRRPPAPVVMGPVKPTTKPSTGPTTAPATAPAAPVVPQTAWLVDGLDADDAKVTALLGQFHPLRTDKYLPASAITAPARRFTVTLTGTSPAPVVVHLDDPGHDLSLVGTCNGLVFNLPTTLATDLAGDFKKAAPVAAVP